MAKKIVLLEVELSMSISLVKPYVIKDDRKTVGLYLVKVFDVPIYIPS